MKQNVLLNPAFGERERECVCVGGGGGRDQGASKREKTERALILDIIPIFSFESGHK